MTLEIGNKAPEFSLNDKDGNLISLKDFLGKYVVLYFYPKDNTSGCTKEAIEFSEELDNIKGLNAEVLGVSPDSEKSHTNFTNKHDLKVTLLSDPEKEVLNAYGAWQLKKMYGREYYGVNRSTFLINPEGKISFIWPKVKVKGHDEEVLEKLKELK